MCQRNNPDRNYFDRSRGWEEISVDATLVCIGAPVWGIAQ